MAPESVAISNVEALNVVNRKKQIMQNERRSNSFEVFSNFSTVLKLLLTQFKMTKWTQICSLWQTLTSDSKLGTTLHEKK